MQEIKKIENHSINSTFSYFLDNKYAITKNDDKLIYWDFTKNWEFQFSNFK